MLEYLLLLFCYFDTIYKIISLQKENVKPLVSLTQHMTMLIPGEATVAKSIP